MAPTLSRARQRLAERAFMWDAVDRRQGEFYSEETPEGMMNFGGGENTLMHPDFKDFLPNTYPTTPALDFTDHILGSSALLSGLSALFNDHFVPHTAVQPGHIIVGNGLSAIIEVLAEVTCDPRPPSQTFTGVNGDVHGDVQEESDVQDVWLIAKPYWAGFDEALDVHLQCRMVGVDVSDSSSSNPSDASIHSNLSQSSTLTAFETTITRLSQQGKRARAIVLCNPHNPLGLNYPRETLEAYACFAEKHDLHLISDEIYALSQFDGPELDHHGPDANSGRKVITTPFTSALSLDPHALGCDPDRIHVLYGLSKDWGANGVRAAALVSQANPALLDAFRGTGMRLKCSSLADALWTALLTPAWTRDRFIRTNQGRLTKAFARCRAFFERLGIPWYTNPEPRAAFFLWIDLSSLHRPENTSSPQLRPPASDREQDAELALAFKQGGVYIPPGYGFHADNTAGHAGWFRFTFALREDWMDEGLRRFEVVVEKRRAQFQVRSGDGLAV